MSETNEKPWRCENREHVLGVVRRNGSGVRQLLLYREAVDLTPGPFPKREGEKEEGMAEVDVFAVVEGYVADVRCSICGRVRSWIPGRESLERLLAQGRKIASLR